MQLPLKEFAHLPERGRTLHTTLLTGRLLSGRWRVGRFLGRGGMSSVYAATHRNGKEVAIKVLHTELAGNERARKRFLREGYIANRVGHDGVVSVLDDEIERDGTVFLVMELVEGANLEQCRLRRGGVLPPAEVLAVADGVLDVLVAAHAKGIVHRDIKPENIFLTTKGNLKLLDFGIASLREVSASVGSTATGVVLGTPGFIAPEQARGRWKEVDARTDIWALGATMLRLLTGRVAHEGETDNELVIAAATHRAPPLLTIDASLPSGLVAAVDRALEPNPLDRWTNAEEMRAAIQAQRKRLPSCELSIPAPVNEPVTLDETSAKEANKPSTSIVERISASRPSDQSALQRLPAYVVGSVFVAMLALMLVHRAGRTVQSESEERRSIAPSASNSSEPLHLSSEGAAISARAEVGPPTSNEIAGGPSKVGELTTHARALPATTVRVARRPVPTASPPPTASSGPPLPPTPPPLAPRQLEDVLDERN